ncbi:CYTH and CHAD domain-containing protein [Ramlibacter humi]|uniref:CYTH and CHAD domain-containing protein n=1 Tax=Ramlibacter humi TaxID=2530451 RepID=A0A4Z0CBX2_9BURK|nr:CYTH and CHAD domain-containing protein [Ramlibacter humi]TFZ07938.1 CYTH and CHAD domain-containing protein [Ramlibacter humi]
MKNDDLKRRRRRVHRGASRPVRLLPAAPEASPAAGLERELKLEVPDGAWEGVARAMRGAELEQVPLRAVYLDTADGALARAGIALRLRREGADWVQTLKARGSGPFERLEDNVPVPSSGDAVPSPDLARHREPRVREALRRAVGDAPAAVLPLFEVSVTRHVRRMRFGDSLVELALDDGRISAAGRTRPIRELELELVEGGFGDLLQLARRWREKHGLWLAVASKAERGRRLAAGELYAPPAHAQLPVLPDGCSIGEFTSAVLASSLEQVLANAGEVAAGSQSDEHVHQLRVGLRRLRSALRELPWLAADRERAEAALAAVFRALGERRDRTHVLHTIQPLVEAAGGPALRMPPGFHESEDLGAAVRGDAFQDTLLALLQRTESVRTEDGDRLKRTLRALLSKLQRQVARDGERYTRLSPERQHRVRKRLKRLRYLAEFAGPLFPQKAVAKYLEAIRPAQEALGDYNDEVMAWQLYGELAHADPDAQFGVDWLAGRQKGEAKACQKALRKMGKAQVFW